MTDPPLPHEWKGCLRIPREGDHGFHGKKTGDSTAKRPLIPREGDHRFHGKNRWVLLPTPF
jgi:hypothetical protein